MPGILIEQHERESKSDLQALHELDLVAQWMDTAFRIPGLGIRFGLDAIVGLIPGFGDTLTSLASIYILSAASRMGVPRATLLRMASNIAVDFLMGSIPLAGDLFDVYWKANRKNVALLRRHVLSEPHDARRARRSDRWYVGLLILGLMGVLSLSVAMAYLMVRGLWRLAFG